MPPKNCAACSKLVFPMEELKCLDKTWHKACFKCQVCNMTLNMKNYKGYGKLPYCNAHYPETKFTVVADTPEAQRLAQNSKIQSNVIYHSDFEQNKGQYTFEYDNPEMRRHLQNTSNTSLIKYHEEFEKAKGQYTAVADDPETLRVKKNMQTISNVTYHGELARKQEMENFRPSEYEPDSQPMSYQAPPASYQPPQQRPPQNYQSAPFMDFVQPMPVDIPYDYRPPNQGPKSYSRPVVTIGKGSLYSTAQAPAAPPPQSYSRQPGSISDYDPMSGRGHEGSPYTNKTQSTTIYNSSSQPQAYRPPQQPAPSADFNPSSQYGGPRGHQQPYPNMHNTTSVPSQQPQYRMSQPSYPQQYQSNQPAAPQQQMRPPPQQEPRRMPPQPQPPRDPFYGKGQVSKSLYDYTAADEDEVTFIEDDIIIHCEPIDDGWMMGTVERTGQHGMLPSNYVERLNW